MTQGKSGPPAVRLDSDFEEIEAAVMETARGRWFLAEFARRNRSADTEMLLDAIGKLELVLHERQSPEGLDHLRRDIMEMATAIAQTRRDLAEMPTRTDGDAGAAGGGAELESIVAQTERATSDILGAAEQIQEIAWTLREQGVAVEPCDALDAHATDIYTACSFQDLTGQRIAKVIAVLDATEKRLGGLVDAWGLDGIEIKPAGGPEDGGATAESEPQPTSSQQEIDRLLIGSPAVPVEAVAEPVPEPDPEPGDPQQAEDPAAAKPAETPSEMTAESSLELFDRLAADLKAATSLSTPAPSPAPERAEPAPAGAGTESAKPAAPEPAASKPQDQSLDLDRLSQAHKTALFS